MKHLTPSQRYDICRLYKAGKTYSEIAVSIGKHRSTIKREIDRNKDKRNGIYKAELAERKYRFRLSSKTKHTRFTSEMQARIEGLLREDYSPEQVHGSLTTNGEDCVSIERIYQHIWKDKRKGGDLYTHLRRRGRKYQKRGNRYKTRGIIKNRVDIDQRPACVDKKNRFGDLEVDLIIGKHHKQAIVTINDRASGMLKMKKVTSKNADVVAQAIRDELQEWKPFLHTITSDNGKEFANHITVSEQLQIDYFFAKPYHSWERGANENLNGLIRQYFPKKMDFENITQKQIKEVENKINDRPRKRHQFKSPKFVMAQLINNTNVAFVT